MLLFFKVSRQDNPTTTRKFIWTLISLMAKREVIWFTYNLVPPPLCWKPLMTWCLPSARVEGILSKCHDGLWAWWPSLTFCKAEIAEWKGGEEAGEYLYLPCLPFWQQEEGSWRKSWTRLSPLASLPLSSPPRTNQRSSRKAQPTPESGVVLVAVDSILHFESLTRVTIQGKKENLSPLSSGIAIFRPAAI